MSARWYVAGQYSHKTEVSNGEGTVCTCDAGDDGFDHAAHAAQIVSEHNSHAGLVALVARYASECGECGGSGSVRANSYDLTMRPCDDCADIRAALAKEAL